MRRNRTLDVIKGICIILIIITHCEWQKSQRLSLLFPFWVDMAVPVFMAISGYVSALSMERNRIDSIGAAYMPEVLVPKFVRYTVPFFIAFLLEQIASAFLKFHAGKGVSVSVSQLLLSFLQGGTGPGSYYYPIMIQFIFIFPIIYFIVRKYDFKGVMLCMAVNGAYEVLKKAYCMNERCYRLLVFRYILVIAAGCFLLIGKSKVKKSILAIFFAVGTLFIIIVKYVSYKPVILSYTAGTSFVACLYIIPIIFLLIKRGKLHFKPLEELGNASYNIFLTQMVYFAIAADYVYRCISGLSAQIIVSIAVCVSAGLVFYRIEKPITNYINDKSMLCISLLREKSGE